VVLGNKSREKLGTLTDSAHTRTVHATTVDHPRGSFWCSTMTKACAPIEASVEQFDALIDTFIACYNMGSAE
jgi:hypothetical protein